MAELKIPHFTLQEILFLKVDENTRALSCCSSCRALIRWFQLFSGEQIKTTRKSYAIIVQIVYGRMPSLIFKGKR